MEPYVDDKQQTMAVRGSLWPPPEQLSRFYPLGCDCGPVNLMLVSTGHKQLAPDVCSSSCLPALQNSEVCNARTSSLLDMVPTVSGPKPEMLAGGRLASDNTILVTIATCGGVALAANWIRTIQALQVCQPVPCIAGFTATRRPIQGVLVVCWQHP